MRSIIAHAGCMAKNLFPGVFSYALTNKKEENKNKSAEKDIAQKQF